MFEEILERYWRETLKAEKMESHMNTILILKSLKMIKNL